MGLFSKGSKGGTTTIPQFKSDPFTDNAIQTTMNNSLTRESQAQALTNSLLGTPVYATETYQYANPNYSPAVEKVAGMNIDMDFLLGRMGGQSQQPKMLTGTRQVQTGVKDDGLLSALGKAPQMGDFENAQYQDASKTYKGMLDIARINAMNDTAQSLQGMQSQFGLAGGVFGESGGRALSSSITAKNQAGLNQYAAEVSDKLINFRSELLSGVYQRLVNKYNATTALQGTLSGQSSAMLNTGTSYKLGIGQIQSGIDIANANIASQEKIAKESQKSSLANSALSIGGSLLGKFLGGL